MKTYSDQLPSTETVQQVSTKIDEQSSYLVDINEKLAQLAIGLTGLIQITQNAILQQKLDSVALQVQSSEIQELKKQNRSLYWLVGVSSVLTGIITWWVA